MKRKEAALAGLFTYNTGKLCKNGHNSDRATRTGACIQCTKEYRVAYKDMIKNTLLGFDQMRDNENEAKEYRKTHPWPVDNKLIQKIQKETEAREAYLADNQSAIEKQRAAAVDKFIDGE